MIIKKMPLLVFVFSCLSTIVFAKKINKKIIFSTFFTPSHEKMASTYLLPSIQDDFEIVIGNCEQLCTSATYYKPGWTEVTKNKVRFIIDLIQQYQGDSIIFSDADIILFRPIKDEIVTFLNSYDLVIQKNNPKGKLCSGFFALNCNEKTLQLWKAVLQEMEHNKNVSDQKALNRFIGKTKNRFDIVWTYLPLTYFGTGTFNGKYWRPEKKFFIPDNPAMFHANYTRFSNKEGLLYYVQQLIMER